MKRDWEYNFKGILAIPARALRAKKIIVSAFYLLLAVLCYNLFGYLALMLEGCELSHIYSVHGWILPALIAFATLPAAFCYYLGILLSVLLLMLGSMTVAGFDFEAMRGNPFFPLGKAVRFSLGRFRQLLLSQLAIVIFVLFILLLGVIIGLLTRIPFLGEWLYALFFVFPNFVVALFTVLIIFVLVLSVLVMPSAVMADRSGETFNSILETFSTITRQPWRWAVYTAYTLVTAKIAGFIFAYFCYRAVQLMQLATSIGGGEKINQIFSSAIGHLPPDSPAVHFVTNLFPGFSFGFRPAFPATGESIGPAGYIMALALFAIFLLVWGYMLSVVATGQAYIFAILKKIRDGHAITDEKSIFHEEEWVNPPITGDKGPSKTNDIST